MFDLSKKSQTTEYFNSIIPKLKGIKIKSIFFLSPPFWHNHENFRTYFYDTDVYILFENDYCLVIDYPFINELKVEFRKMTSQEKYDYERTYIKDIFNTVNHIHSNTYSNKICRVESCELEYGSIEKVTIRSVIGEYTTCVNNDFDFFEATEETFDEIEFTMSNGKSFIICADDAEADGYVLIWSKDTNETIIQK